jgi:hypothetical protein
MSMQEHTVVSDRSQRYVEMYNKIQRGVLVCMEEAHLAGRGDASPSQHHIVLIDHLPCTSRDERWRVVANNWRSYFRLYWMIGIQ